MKTFLTVLALTVAAFISAPPAGASDYPTVTMPTAPLVTRVPITITGSGWTPNSTLSLVECGVLDDPGPVVTGDCGLAKTLAFTTTDANGNFSTTYTPRKRFLTADGVDTHCGRMYCSLSVFNVSTYLNGGNIENVAPALTFASR